MIMAVKYQIMLCKSGRELLLLTLNHLDGIRHMIDDDDDHARLINSVLTRFVGLYDRLSQAQLMVIRQTLLMFFQDYHKKVGIHAHARSFVILQAYICYIHTYMYTIWV